MKKNKIKKAELTSKQLITIIILIVSFSIILIFFFALNLRGSIDEESCRNSVAMRGLIPIFKNAVTLKCKTQNICFSNDNCPSGYTKESVVNEKELSEKIFELMEKCFWMMGEGKVEYSSSGCAICYKLYFGEDIREKYPEIKYESVYNNKNVYDFYELTSLNSIANVISNRHNIDIFNDKIDLSKEYVIVDSYYKEHNPPIIVEFSGSELNDKLKCKEYVTQS